MRQLVILWALLLVGCDGVESTFVLAASSPLPAGILADEQLASVTKPRVEIWFYTRSSNPVGVKVFNAAGQLVFERQGDYRWATPADAPVEFFVTVNGVETGYSRNGLNNVLSVVEAP